MKRLLITALLILLSQVSYAQKSTDAMIEELLKIAKIENMLSSASTQAESYIKQQVKMMSLPEEAEEFAQPYINQVKVLIGNEFEWKKVRKDFIRIYKEVFTKEELEDIINFYKTPSGQKMVEYGPILMEKSMIFIQEKLESLTPQINSIGGDMANDLKKRFPR